MNFARLDQVKAAIIENPGKYDQSAWLHGCGTPACIAGWAAHLSLQDGESLVWCGPTGTDVGVWSESSVPLVIGDTGAVFDIAHRAKEWLGLSRDEAQIMFEADPLPWGEPISPDDAVAMLDHAIETGNIVWGIEKDD